ncbi:MAG TPA: c-type cytochrome [Thermoanaerobaculia bacterium]|nr:c-type cytochrome [Thermoanaerobaculia bacterium]
MRKHLAVFLLALAFLGCTATTPQPAASSPSAAGYKNLKVLPRDISREQLLAIMRTFTRSLGVKCNHCHVVTATTPKEELDFPSDAKEEKRVARVMIQMTNQINREWLERVEQAEGHEEADAPAAEGAMLQPRVGCWTCHRGQVEPELPPPPPPPAAPR